MNCVIVFSEWDNLLKQVLVLKNFYEKNRVKLIATKYAVCKLLSLHYDGYRVWLYNYDGHKVL